MRTAFVEAIGSSAAIITTLCWLPQALKIIREKETGGISLVTQSALAVGMLLWLFYGALLGSVPMIISNGLSFALVSAILALKLRYG